MPALRIHFHILLVCLVLIVIKDLEEDVMGFGCNRQQSFANVDDQCFSFVVL